MCVAIGASCLNGGARGAVGRDGAAAGLWRAASGGTGAMTEDLVKCSAGTVQTKQVSELIVRQAGSSAATSSSLEVNRVMSSPSLRTRRPLEPIGWPSPSANGLQ